MHDVVTSDKRGGPVEELGAEATESVEDGVVSGAGKGVLAVRADTVGDDALLLHAT